MSKKRQAKSARWRRMQEKDVLTRQARRAGYRSRAAYKLLEIDDSAKLLKKGMTVADLGAAPGGWSQVIVSRIGAGRVVAVDKLAMTPIDGVHFVCGDFTLPAVVREVMAGVGGGSATRRGGGGLVGDFATPRKFAGANFHPPPQAAEGESSAVGGENFPAGGESSRAGGESLGDSRFRGNDQGLDYQGLDSTAAGESFRAGDESSRAAGENFPAGGGRILDWVVSDMSPDISGIAVSDQARMRELGDAALFFARAHLRLGGGLLFKFFQGVESQPFAESLKECFSEVRAMQLKSSRDSSREIYFLARGLFLG